LFKCFSNECLEVLDFKSVSRAVGLSEPCCGKGTSVKRGVDDGSECGYN